MTESHSASHPSSPLDTSRRGFASATSIGIRFDRIRAEARGVLLSFLGSPLQTAPEIRLAEAEPLSSELLCRFSTVEQNESDFEVRCQLTSELTAIATRLAQSLIVGATSARTSSIASRHVVPSDDILAIGIHGAGTWMNLDRQSRSYCEYIDASRIAEQFGKTVIDDFPSRDLAQGGRGGPVEAHGIWLLLADRSPGPGCHWRALLDLSPHATHCSMVGPVDRHLRSSAISSSDICVGSRLLSELIAITKGAAKISDPLDLGKAAAAGRVIPELEEIWLATSGQSNHWSPEGVSALPLVYAFQNSVYATAPLENQLATAIHFVAHQVERHIKHGIPASNPVGELFVMGEGSKNGLMIHLLNEMLPAVSIRRLSELGQDRTLHAASIAALTLLHIWQVPVPSTNTSEVPRVLGRITPGSPSNWQFVLQAMTSNAPWLLPLREAI